MNNKKPDWTALFGAFAARIGMGLLLYGLWAYFSPYLPALPPANPLAAIAFVFVFIYLFR